ncbi:MAG: DUF3854 domain-containing protein, partial [Dolichospermum sp.]
FLKRYAHTLNGGWWCSGVDPLNNYDPMGWGCFKADNPRLDPKKNKPIKYEHPAGVATRAFFLRVPIGDCKEFWEWVLNHDIPITITEGAKKAAALLSVVIVAMGLPGINSGYRKIDNVGRFLIADLASITKIPRKITVCFDNDSKITTKINVERATNTLGKLLK